MKVLEDVPFITGLDSFLTPRLEAATIDFLKEMGAACAAIGAVGLYHVENITPEAIDHGNKLLRPDYRTYTIDDQELDALFLSYPVMWEDRQAEPRKCMIGCPHLSLKELYWWTDNICDVLQAAGRKQVAIETLMCAAPQIIQKFKEDEKEYSRLKRTGVKLTDTCPEAYMNNRLCAREAVVTNSNKFRAFTTARMYLDHDLIQVIVGGKV
jgi:predicted aconitase